MDKDKVISHLLKIIRPTAVLLSSDSCRTIIKQLSDDNATIVGRIVFSMQGYKI